MVKTKRLRNGIFIVTGDDGVGGGNETESCESNESDCENQSHAGELMQEDVEGWVGLFGRCRVNEVCCFILKGYWLCNFGVFLLLVKGVDGD